MSKFIATSWLTYINKIKSKSFIIITLILAICILIAFNYDKINENFKKQDSIGFVSKSKQEYTSFKKLYKESNKHSHLKYIKSKSKALKMLKDKKIDKIYDFKVKDRGKISIEIIDTHAVSKTEKQELQQMTSPMQQSLSAQSNGLNDKMAKKLYQQSDIHSKTVNNKNIKKLSEKELNFNKVLAYILTIVLVFVVMNYISQISMEIANEKTSRVIEMIITSVMPYQHILAKIFGIIMVALTQIIILALTSVLSYKLFNGKNLFDEFNLSLTTDNYQTILIALLLWLLAVVGYIILGAIVGSLVSRIEDVGQAIMPLSLLVLFSFYISLFNFSNPDSNIIKVCSYIPYISPFALLVRLTNGNYQNWEVVLSLIVFFICIIFSLLIAAKTYKSAILAYNKPFLKILKKRNK